MTQAVVERDSAAGGRPSGTRAAGLRDTVGEGERDVAACVLLCAVTGVYLYLWPHDFYGFDEGIYLYEAKRVWQGEVMYRDFFNIITPAFLYLMAGLYGLLGVSFESARTGMAVLHGLIGVLSYLTCRRVQVRRPLAFLVALCHIALCYPASPIATPHWMSTVITLALLLVVLHRPGTTARRVLLWGALAGLLLLVQQHRGTFIAAAAGLVIAVDAILVDGGLRWRPVLGRAVSYLAGILAVVAPVMTAFIVAAGPQQVLRALVWFPFDNYRRINPGGRLFTAYLASLLGREAWVSPHLADVLPLPFVAQYLPLAIILAALLALRQWVGGADIARRRSLLVLLLFSAGALLSVMYLPNHVHFAFVAPVWLTLAALLLETLLRTLERAVPAAHAAATGAAVLLICGAAWQMQRTLDVRHRWHGVSTPTAFGRVDHAWENSVAELRCLEEWLRNEGAKEMFVFPASPGLYLLTGTPNATRYQIALPGYTDRDQLEEIVAALEARQVPVVVQTFYFEKATLDPLTDYVQRHYDWVGPPVNPGGFPVMKVYRRRPDGMSPDDPATRHAAYLRRKMPCPTGPASVSGS